MDENVKAENLRQSLFEAMEIFSNDISKRTNDKALELECVISKIRDKAVGEYIVEYQGTKFKAYSASRELYKIGDVVYILIPEGDLSKTKYIIGYANPRINDEQISLYWNASKNLIEVFKGAQSLGFINAGEGSVINHVYYEM